MKKEYISASVQVTMVFDDVITTSIEDVSGRDYAIFDPRR